MGLAKPNRAEAVDLFGPGCVGKLGPVNGQRALGGDLQRLTSGEDLLDGYPVVEVGNDLELPPAPATGEWVGMAQPGVATAGSSTAYGFLMAVSIETQPVFRPGTPRKLFRLPERPERDTPVFEDVTPDGKRFL